MSDLSGFTDEIDEELRSYSDEDAVVSACPHRLIYSGFCADCGEPVDQGKESEKKVKMNYLELTMSTEYRDQHENALKRELLEERKLALVLDLDHTLLHTVMKYPQPGQLRTQNPTRLHKHAYHPRAPQHTFPANQPAVVPDPRRAQTAVNNARPEQGSAGGNVEPTVCVEQATGNRQPNHSTQASTSGEADAVPAHGATKEINGAARGEGADATAKAATSEHKDVGASQPDETAAPTSRDDEAHNSPECTVASAPCQPDGLPICAEADVAHVAPKAAITNNSEGSESPRKSLKRARSAEQSDAPVGETQAAAVEAATRLQAPCDSTAQARAVQATPSPVSTHSQVDTVSAAGARQESITGGAGGSGPGRVDAESDPQDPTRTPSGEFEFPSFWTKLRPGAREMLHELQDHFRFYIFTMGDKTYAEAMATLLDPEGRHFRARIVNRSDAVSSASGRSSPGGRAGPQHVMVKTLQQVGISGQVAAVLDDTSEVWKEDYRNLLRVPRYHWFPPTNNDGSPMRAGPPGLAAQSTDDDPVTGPLATICERLREAHRRFFAWHDPTGSASCGKNGASPSDPAACKADGCMQPRADGSKHNNAQPGTVGGVAGTSHGLWRNHNEEADAGVGPPDVRVCLQSMRREVLQGCRITFSQVMDGTLKAQPQYSAFWQLATSLGATCCHGVDAPVATDCSSIEPPAEGTAANGGDMTAGNSSGMGEEAQSPSQCGGEGGTQRQDLHVTHVVSLSRFTDKAHRAQERKGVALVSPDWLLASEIKWKKAEEKDFPVPSSSSSSAETLLSWARKVPAEDIQALRQLGSLTAHGQGGGAGQQPAVPKPG